MAEPRDIPSPTPSPNRRFLVGHGLVKVLVIAEIVALIAAYLLWTELRPDARENAANPGLRGSLPPAGAVVAPLDQVAGIQPTVPPPATLGPAAIVATCLDCRSGDVIGGFLGRLPLEDVPEGARIVVVGWGGDARAWRAEWSVPRQIGIHVARSAPAAAALRRRLGVGESGMILLLDERGTWRSTFHLGQIDRDDMLHDLRRLAR